MEFFYTSEKNTQILIALMKAHNIKKIVASPGTTNLCLVGSLQNDPYFEIYSSADERSAAYIACGLAAESGEPVALSCTGATASRNYVSAMTEAYYRKLPILAITSTQHPGRIGQHIAQVIDRTVPINDTVNLSVQIPTVNNAEDEWATTVQINKALLELRHRGGGPVHINLATTYSKDFSVKELPDVRVIRRIGYDDELPFIEENSRVGIFVGAHQKMSDRLSKAIDSFCSAYDGVVICDHTSNYKGKYKVDADILMVQKQYNSPVKDLDIVIHIGEISGSTLSVRAKQVWRVSPDGEIRDTFKKLTYVFEMEETRFFERYSSEAKDTTPKDKFVGEWKSECNKIWADMPELPFSNAWIAGKTIPLLPKGCVLHLGILNSLRTWNFYEIDDSINVYSNTGGFGIDGCVSSLIGASLADKNKLYFGTVGDLAFFYDMNAIGNRHVGNNIRIMVVNNGRGTEFRNYNHPAARFGEDADMYMAAAGHYGKQSKDLLKHYSQDLGFEYICASNKEEYLEQVKYFTQQDMLKKPVLFEVFTDSADESKAIEMIHNIETSTTSSVKKLAKNILGDKGVETIKNLVKKG